MSECRLLCGDARSVLATLPDASVQCVISSPPYWNLRDYDAPGQIGLEPTLQEYLLALVGVFREVRRVLHPTGTCWINIGDTYASAWSVSRRNVIGSGSLVHGKRADRPNRLVDGLKEKDLCLVPARLAIALQDDGWWVRADTIWHKPNPMPESVTDRPTKAHEYLYLLTKAEQYYYNAAAIAEPVVKGAAGSSFTHGKTGLNGLGRVGLGERVETGTRNKRSVWTVPTTPFPDAHFAVMPEALVEPCILAGSRLGDTVLDPFVGSGTVCAVATRLGRRSIGIDLNPAYLQMAEKRVLASCPEARGQLPLLEAI